MDLIKKGIGLSQTIKNAGRFKEIVSVLARNGLDEFIIKTGIASKVPDFVVPQSRIDNALEEYDEDSWAQTFGYRLRKSFEELGPGFVKLGQLMSTREDMFPVTFIFEMKKLQDKVKPISYEEAQKVIENSLEKSVEDVFSSLDPKPIGTASIGVAFKGQLKNGEKVVVKVRRPHILKTIHSDIALLDIIIGQIEKVSNEVRFLGLSKIIKDFGSSLETELDYRVEARQCVRFKENMQLRDKEGIFHVPKIYKEYSSERILVMELLEGVPFSDAEGVNAVKAVIHDQLEKGIRLFIHSILTDGFFHADLHGGNFFLLDNHKIGIIDYGLMGTLGKQSRTHLVAILYSLTTHNYENLVYEFLDVAEYETIPDVDALIRDVRECLSPYVGLTVQQVNVSALFRTIMGTLSRHQMYLPRDWFMVFRAIITLDGVGKSLDMDFDIYGIVAQDIKGIIKESFSKEYLIEEGLWLGRDMVSSLRGIPRHLRWFLRDFSKRNYAFEVEQRGYEKYLKRLSHSIVYLGSSFFAGVLAFSGVFLLKDAPVTNLSDIPNLSWILWALSLVGISWSYRKATKKKYD